MHQEPPAFRRGETQLLQVFNQRRRTGRLDVQGASAQGQIFYVQGQLVHAECEQEVGENALVRLCQQTAGNYQFWTTDPSARRSINRDHQNLLMWAVQMIDEGNQALLTAAQSVDLSVLAGGGPEPVRVPGLDNLPPVQDLVFAPDDFEVEEPPAPEPLVDPRVWERCRLTVANSIGPVALPIMVRQARKLGLTVTNNVAAIPRSQFGQFLDAVAKSVSDEDRPAVQNALQSLQREFS